MNCVIRAKEAEKCTKKPADSRSCKANLPLPAISPLLYCKSIQAASWIKTVFSYVWSKTQYTTHFTCKFMLLSIQQNAQPFAFMFYRVLDKVNSWHPFWQWARKDPKSCGYFGYIWIYCIYMVILYIWIYMSYDGIRTNRHSGNAMDTLYLLLGRYWRATKKEMRWKVFTWISDTGSWSLVIQGTSETFSITCCCYTCLFINYQEVWKKQYTNIKHWSIWNIKQISRCFYWSLVWEKISLLNINIKN